MLLFAVLKYKSPILVPTGFAAYVGTPNEPVTCTEPVKSCVSSVESPNLVDPDWYIIEDEIIVE